MLLQMGAESLHYHRCCPWVAALGPAWYQNAPQGYKAV